MIRGTVCGNVCTYGSVGALGEQSPRATRNHKKGDVECVHHRPATYPGGLCAKEYCQQDLLCHDFQEIVPLTQPE